MYKKYLVLVEINKKCKQTNLYMFESLLIRLINTAISKNRAYPESSFTMAHISNSFCLLIRIKSNLISSIG